MVRRRILIALILAGLATAGSPSAASAQLAGPSALPAAPAHPGVADLLDALAEAGDEASAKRLERAILRAWMRSGSDTVDLLMQRAVETLEAKQYAAALEILDAVVELAPDYAEGWNKRATLYYLIDEYERSIADIGRTLALEPRHFGALSGLGTILREIDLKERALQAYRRAIAVHPYLENAREAAEQLAKEIGGRDI